MRKMIFALAAGLLAATASAASAMPAAKAAQAGSGINAERSSSVETVDYRDRRRMLHKRDGDRRWHRRHHSRNFDWNDRRYSSYRGWNRYYDRPYRWRSRGCVAVGPIWFCP